MTRNLPQRDETAGKSISRTPRDPTQGSLAAIRLAIGTVFRPRPLPKPVVDRQLAKLPAIERIAEVARYSLARLEYALSPGGGLRAWCRLQVLLALVVGVPALLVVPVITLWLGAFAGWAEVLAATTRNLLCAVLASTAAGSLVAVVIFVIRRLISGR